MSPSIQTPRPLRPQAPSSWRLCWVGGLRGQDCPGVPHAQPAGCDCCPTGRVSPPRISGESLPAGFCHFCSRSPCWLPLGRGRVDSLLDDCNPSSGSSPPASGPPLPPGCRLGSRGYSIGQCDRQAEGVLSTGTRRGQSRARGRGLSLLQLFTEEKPQIYEMLQKQGEGETPRSLPRVTSR